MSARAPDTSNAAVIAGERDCPRIARTTLDAWHATPKAQRAPCADADTLLGELLSQISGEPVRVARTGGR